MPNEFLLNIGLVMAGVSVIGGILTAVFLRSHWKRLNTRLDAEYGKKRR